MLCKFLVGDCELGKKIVLSLIAANVYKVSKVDGVEYLSKRLITAGKEEGTYESIGVKKVRIFLCLSSYFCILLSEILKLA